MPFTANIAVEEEVIMAAIMIAFFYIYTPADVYNTRLIEARVATLLHNDFGSRSTKLARI